MAVEIHQKTIVIEQISYYGVRNCGHVKNPLIVRLDSRIVCRVQFETIGKIVGRFVHLKQRDFRSRVDEKSFLGYSITDVEAFRGFSTFCTHHCHGRSS